jgi:hypothetical protein
LISSELDPANKIEALPDLRGADPTIAATRDSLSQAKPDDYGRVSRRYGFNGPCFDVCVGKQNVHRALLLLHSLVHAFKKRGFQIVPIGSQSRELHIQVFERQFRISVWEPSKRQKRELTEDEKRRKEEYSWSSIRDYNYVPTGMLELYLDRGGYYSKGRVADTKRAPLENRLNDLIVCMLENVDQGRVEAERERLEAIEKQKRKTAAVQLEVIHRSEEVRENRLLKTIPEWKRSRQIRDYIEAVRAEALRRYVSIDDASENGQNITLNRSTHSPINATCRPTH